MNYIRQIIFEMRHQPLMTWLSVAGTAIAIFLIMSDFMINNIDSVSVAPESKRSRIVYGYGGHTRSENNSNSGFLSFELARELYSDLDGVEAVSYSSADPYPISVCLPGSIPENCLVRQTDEVFWDIYDYDFIEGAPFSKEEVESGVPIAIMTRSMAEHFFGKNETYIGREILVENRPYRISGIVADINPLMSNTLSDVFVSHVSYGLPTSTWSTYLGSYQPVLLLKEGTDLKHVRQQVETRYNLFNKHHEKDGVSLIYHEQPWSNEEKNTDAGSNTTPDLTMKHRSRLIGYLILLIIPAINLSSMTRSRMRQRVSEIGLRRAFGCSRSRIVLNLLTENFIISIIGGIIGLTLSIIFIVSFSNYFIDYNGWMINTVAQTMSRPTLPMLFSWRAFAAVMIFCFLLNILSAGIPAIKASFINPAEAISGHNVHK